MRSGSPKPQRAATCTHRVPLCSSLRRIGADALHRFGGRRPVSARNARAKLRGLMQQRAASASTPGPVQVRAGEPAEAPRAALSQRRELGLPPGAVIDHQLLRRALRDLLAEVLAISARPDRSRR
jgi:hypothetical protein